MNVNPNRAKMLHHRSHSGISPASFDHRVSARTTRCYTRRLPRRWELNSLTGTVLLVQHMDDGREDRVAMHLARRGFALDWRNPARGDPLPRNQRRYAAAVVYGGSQSVTDAGRLGWMQAEIDWVARWVEADRPYLGLCLGGQLLACAMGARVAAHPRGLHEIGFVRVRPAPGAEEFLAAPLHVYQWHSEGFRVPARGELLAQGEAFPNQAFRVGRQAFALQFHPEATARMRARWLDESAHMLTAPGAHGRERQQADARRFDARMQAWLTRFIDTQLLPAG